MRFSHWWHQSIGVAYVGSYWVCRTVVYYYKKTFPNGLLIIEPTQLNILDDAMHGARRPRSEYIPSKSYNSFILDWQSRVRSEMWKRLGPTTVEYALAGREGSRIMSWILRYIRVGQCNNATTYTGNMAFRGTFIAGSCDKELFLSQASTRLPFEGHGACLVYLVVWEEASDFTSPVRFRPKHFWILGYREKTETLTTQ
jgi:hypothetical protein